MNLEELTQIIQQVQKEDQFLLAIQVHPVDFKPLADSRDFFPDPLGGKTTENRAGTIFQIDVYYDDNMAQSMVHATTSAHYVKHSWGEEWGPETHGAWFVLKTPSTPELVQRTAGFHKPVVRTNAWEKLLREDPFE